ncbi:MAG: SUMF1/EgtB/PvdO family nonheme iron enzyme [Phycisphaerales bacterium]|nr:SUMF1/EgtB/PvdO family nonheme iron enzyme [Phycisphaerales bacterium]
MAVFGRISGVFRRVVAVFAAAAGVAGLAPGASAQAPPDFGLSWKTIGDPGNRATNPSEVGNRPTLQIGAVGYEYRMSTTEVTIGLWAGFVRAYLPINPRAGNTVSFLGPGIFVDSVTREVVVFGNPLAPTRMGWEWAARYCNWLHNGAKPNAAAADFANGAYDTSTFTRNSDGSYNHQLTRSPGAKFWIPSLDEWTKATYWDPSKNGPGVGGYWRYPGKSDVPLISGPPEQGGQTNAGPNGGPSSAGSYPNVTSPWGLLDTSGGVSEWTSTPLPGFSGAVYIKGSRQSGFLDPDQIDLLPGSFVFASDSGLRLASVVPTPSSGATFILGVVCALRRRRALWASS